MQWFYWINPELSFLWAVSIPLGVTKIWNEKRNQTDKIHVIAWEESANNINILKCRRPFKSYMTVSKKRDCPREFSKLGGVVIALTGLSN